MISARDHERFRPFLIGGERILWSGSPRSFGSLFRDADLWLVPLTLLFALAEFWFLPSHHASFAATLMRRSGEFTVLCLATGHTLFHAWRRNRLLYAVTNRRVLVLRTGRRPRANSIEIGDFPLFEYEEQRSGLGTLRFDFERSPWLAWLGKRRPTAGATGMRFELIERPREVYDLIQRETDRWRQERYGELSGPRSFIG